MVILSAINTLSKILEIIFFNKRTSNKDAEESILAIHINVINMVNAFTSLQMDFLFPMRNYCKRYKRYFAFADK